MRSIHEKSISNTCKEVRKRLVSPPIGPDVSVDCARGQRYRAFCMANGLISPVTLSSKVDPNVGWFRQGGSVRWSGGGDAPNGCSGGAHADRYWSGRPESSGGMYGGWRSWWRPLRRFSKPGGQRTAQQIYVALPNHALKSTPRILGNARLLIG